MDTPFPSRSAAARGEEEEDEEELDLLLEADEDELELLEDELSFDCLCREDALSSLELLEDELSSNLMLSSDLISFTSHLTSLGIFTWEQPRHTGFPGNEGIDVIPWPMPWFGPITWFSGHRGHLPCFHVIGANYLVFMSSGANYLVSDSIAPVTPCLGCPCLMQAWVLPCVAGFCYPRPCNRQLPRWRSYPAPLSRSLSLPLSLFGRVALSISFWPCCLAWPGPRSPRTLGSGVVPVARPGQGRGPALGCLRRVVPTHPLTT